MTRAAWWRRSGVAGAVLLVVGIIGLAAWAWVHVPALYPLRLGPNDPPTVIATKEATRSHAIVTTRASVLAALAGLGALITIGINYRNSRINARTLETTNETFRVTERGHLTDRYTKAIEQLGNSESIAIRLGGIYALQQLAVDTTRDADQVTVVEVLSAFVRLNLRDDTAPLPGTDTIPQDDQQVQVPRADVLAAISVLAQLPTRSGAPRRADFTGLSFTSLRLSDARLSNANLAGVNLAGVNLTGADLARADLARADLARADLAGVNLADANLPRCKLAGAVLAGADLTYANLAHAVLARADLTGADVTRADLTGAFLSNAKVIEANLTGANLARAAFTNADLTGADLTGADLTGAFLTEADLTDADLTDANLTGTFLADTNVTRAKLGAAKGLVAGQLDESQRAIAGTVPDPGAPTARE